MFLHIPRTGGTSLRKLFSSWYRKKLCNAYVKGVKVEPFVWSFLFKNNYKCIYGHYDIGHIPIVMFLREPLSQQISYYNYTKKYWKKNYSMKNIDNFFIEEPSSMLQFIPDNKKRIVFCGIYEDFENELLRLADYLGNQIKPVQHINKAKVLERPSDYAVKVFRENNKEVFEFYDYYLSKKK